MNVCHYHFDHMKVGGIEAGRNEAKSCAECQTQDAFARGKSQWEDTIDPFQPIGVHIDLVCRRCGTGFHTKNISHIGARSIFAVGIYETDCDHGVRELEVARA